MHKNKSVKPKCTLRKGRFHTLFVGRVAARWSTRWWRERASCTEVCLSLSRKAGPQGSHGKPAVTANMAAVVSTYANTVAYRGPEGQNTKTFLQTKTVLLCFVRCLETKCCVWTLRTKVEPSECWFLHIYRTPVCLIFVWYGRRHGSCLWFLPHRRSRCRARCGPGPRWTYPRLPPGSHSRDT